MLKGKIRIFGRVVFLETEVFQHSSTLKTAGISPPKFPKDIISFQKRTAKTELTCIESASAEHLLHCRHLIEVAWKGRADDTVP